MSVGGGDGKQQTSHGVTGSAITGVAGVAESLGPVSSAITGVDEGVSSIRGDLPPNTFTVAVTCVKACMCEMRVCVCVR